MPQKNAAIPVINPLNIGSATPGRAIISDKIVFPAEIEL